MGTGHSDLFYFVVCGPTDAAELRNPSIAVSAESGGDLMELITTIITTIFIIAAATWTSWSFYHLITHVISHRPSSAAKQKDIQRQNREDHSGGRGFVYSLDPEKDLQRRNREKFHRKMKAGNVIVDEPAEILGQKVTSKSLHRKRGPVSCR